MNNNAAKDEPNVAAMEANRSRGESEVNRSKTESGGIAEKRGERKADTSAAELPRDKEEVGELVLDEETILTYVILDEF